MAAQGQFSYTTSGGAVTVTGYNGPGDALTIPSTINGLPVTCIGAGAFVSNTSLTSVTIPNSVITIGGAAFAYSDITGVTIGDSVASIGAYAFAECYHLASVVIPDSVTNLVGDTFNDCISLTSVTVGSGVTSIGYGAFQWCYGLTNVCFSGNAPIAAIDLGEGIFAHDYRLETIHYVEGRTGWGAYLAWGADLAIPTTPCGQCGAAATTITPLRLTLEQAAVAPSDDIDARIVPVTDTNKLQSQNGPILNALGLGVVADGVTAVLFNIAGSPGAYSLCITGAEAGYQSISTNLFVLEERGWTQTTNFTITASEGAGTGTAFAYLQGLEWADFDGLSTSNDVPLTLEVSAGGAAPIASTTFRVRPPPVALIHGYCADGGTWSQDFLDQLLAVRPDSFVVRVNYGVSGGTPTTYPNTRWDLRSLAALLDTSLQTQVEKAVSSDWAFTRYDVVGHSQGGLLARMLCQITPNGSAPFSSAPIVSPQNFYRGRFRRVVTIGSPHNGSVLLRYLLQCERSDSELVNVIPRLISPYLQSKFDPFGPQIREANNPLFPVDRRMNKFRCIAATINSGQPPMPGKINPLCYSLFSLTQNQPGVAWDRGQVLLPKGSDGVVDFLSQGAGAGTPVEVLSNSTSDTDDIAHADISLSVYPPSLVNPLFGVPAGHSETTLFFVGEKVTELLNGPADPFGPFQLPSLLAPIQQQTIDSLVPPITILDLIVSGGDPPSTFNYAMQLPEGLQAGGQIAWFAEAFSTNGVSEEGFTVQVNATNSAQVAVTVDESLRGTVVLYAYYAATNGELVYARPVGVYSSFASTALNAIALEPSATALYVGDTLAVEVWGQYTNGASMLLYLPPGVVGYESSDSSVATVDTNGIITMNSFGSATITGTYNGMTALTVVTARPSAAQLEGAKTTNGVFQFSFTGTPGTTNIVEASTDLVSWVSIATVYNEDGFLTYQDGFSTNLPAQFYRLKTTTSPGSGH
jgi:pimeloyl-ACP methyl ester carboxylesterase